MTRDRDVPALARRLLRAVLPLDQASAIEGDLLEELRSSAGAPRRWPRAWLSIQALRLTGAALGWLMMRRLSATIRLSLRDAWRVTRASPTTSALAVAVIALGIAAATVTFSVVDTVVLRALPFEHSDRLIVISGETDRGPIPLVSAAEYVAWRDQLQTAEVAAWTYRLGRLQRGDDKRIIVSLIATPEFLKVLRAAPALGPGFSERDDNADVDPVVISDALWRGFFNSDPRIIGSTISLEGQTVRVTGVMPPGFQFPDGPERIDLWRRYVPTAEERSLSAGRSSSLRIIGRLRDDHSLTAARSEIEATSAALAAAHKDLFGGWRVRVTMLKDSMIGAVRGWMLMVLWAVALVMTIACVNVANLLLARGAARSRDLGVRSALGAARWQLVASLLTESLLLAAVAGGAGILVAALTLDLVTASLPAGIARAGHIAIDTRVLIAAMAMSAASGLLFGLLPATQSSRVDVASLLRSGGAPSVGDRRRRVRTALLVAQVAFVVVLVVATGLVVGSFARVVWTDLGFDPAPIAAYRVGVALPAGASPEAQRAAIAVARTRALDEARAIPGVTGVALSAGGAVPFASGSTTMLAVPPGAPDQSSIPIDSLWVTSSYFDVMAVPVRRGRVFDDDPNEQSVMLDEHIAAQLFGEADPINQLMTLRGYPQPYRVIGVVASVRPQGPEQEIVPRAYFPIGPRLIGGFDLLVRAANRPDVAAAALAELPARWSGGMRGINKPVVLRDQWRRLTASRRFSAGVMAALGVLALIIGAAGIYGVMSAVVTQRRREMGVRAALGATAARLVRETLADAGRWLLLGAGIGVAAAWAIGGVLSSLLFGVTPRDPLIYALAVALLLIVGLIAAWLPARRAGRVDPLIVLRTD
ncbi:MAG TPA: ADOP family duplicated permease [Vicinamibacterales bacterium]|nr:ADOP family duplicated permease [Vicinamibacterales bacterium]